MSTFGTLLFIISFLLNLHCNVVIASGYRGTDNNSCAKGSYEELCLLPVCVEEAANIMKNMNKHVDPCDNFYEFVCGHFIKKQAIPADTPILDIFYIAYKELRNELLNDMKSKIKTNDLLPIKKYKIFYQNCVNTSRIEEEKIEPAFELIEKLGGWPVLVGDDWDENDYHWDETITKISEAGLEPIFPIKLTIERDSIDSEKKIIMLQPTDTTVNDAYFLEGSKNMDALKAYMADIAVMFGADRDAAQKEMEDCLDFEIKLHKIQTPLQTMFDLSPVETRLSIKDLTRRYEKISWLSILNRIVNPSGISINENENIEIQDPKYITEIGQLINDTPKRILANYQIWQQISMLIDYMPLKFEERKLLFRSVTDGVQRMNGRENLCADKVIDVLQIAVSAMYVRKYFNKKIKDNVNNIVQNIKYQVKENLEVIDWMDKDTRLFAIEKLNAMDYVVAYPDELLDDKRIDKFFQNLDIEIGSYINNFINVTTFMKNINFRKLRDPVNDWIKDAEAATINAMYLDSTNKITLPAGILRNHFYNIERPQYLNYGTIGYIIAHEITHAFDKEGRNYDKNGNYKNWWDKRTAEKFNEKSKCIIDQYNNFIISQIDLKMDGKLSLSENIADNGAVKLAYLAYKKWTADNNIIERRLPALNYTPQQMFWISAASVSCSKLTDEFLRDQIKNDVHSPSEARVTVGFSNNEHFANDFKCKIGSKMNPVNKCHLW